MVRELAAMAAAEAVAAGKRKAIQIGLYAGAAVLTLVAAIFALDGLHAIIAASYGPVAASFIIAGALVLMALGVYIAGRMVKRRHTTADLIAATAMVAAPVAARLIAPHATKRIGGLAGLLLGALLGRQMGSP